MSRKSKRNPSQPPSAQPQPQPQPQSVAPPSAVNRRNIFIAVVVLLLVAFAVVAIVYKREQAQSLQLTAAGNQPALSSEHAPTLGKAEAKVHIVEFFDPACETCAVFFPHVKKLLADHPGKIRLSVRHVPFHKGSELVVQILEASRNQGRYLPALEAFYASQHRWVVNHVVQPDQVWAVLGGLGLDLERLRNDINAPEVARRIALDMNDARTLGVTKTPEFFVNGRPMPSFGLEQLHDLVAEELRRAYP